MLHWFMQNTRLNQIPIHRAADRPVLPECIPITFKHTYAGVRPRRGSVRAPSQSRAPRPPCVPVYPQVSPRPPGPDLSHALKHTHVILIRKCVINQSNLTSLAALAPFQFPGNLILSVSQCLITARAEGRASTERIINCVF